jgi:cytoskeleton protein RodZ
MRPYVANARAAEQSESIDTEERVRKGVGSLLRATRVRVGEDIQDVSSVLRIRRTYLEAIEDGRFADLPGLTYAIGFVRTYAEHLGLDGDEVVRRFKAEAQGIGATNDLVFPSPVQEGRIPGGAVLFIAMLLAVGAYGGWYYLSSQGKTIADLVPELPEKFSGIIGGGDVNPDSAVVPQPAVEPAEPVTSAPVEEKPESAEPDTATTETSEPGVTSTGDTAAASAGDTAAANTDESQQPEEPQPVAQADPEPQAAPTVPVTEATPAPAATPEPAPAQAANPAPAAPSDGLPITDVPPANAPAAPAPATVATVPGTAAVEQEAAVPAATTYGSDADDVRIVLLAVQDAWIQIREGNGDLVSAQLLRPGERYRVPNRTGLQLLTGNAGGLEVLVDGTPAPRLGPEGAIRRNVPLEADSLMNMPAAQ